MNKEYPLPENEVERIQALKNYYILDTEIEAEFERLTELASLACNMPISLITLLDENRQWFKSRRGINVRETPREMAFCQYTIMHNELLEIEDARQDDRFFDNVLVTQEPHIVFYAAVPLIDSKGFALGTICVIDNQPNKLSDNQIKILEILAVEVSTLIQKRSTFKELENFENIFKISNDLICIAGTDGFFKKINPAFSNVLGWEESYLLKTSYFDLIHSDDLEEVNNEISKLAEGGFTINFAHRLKQSNNDYKIIQWIATREPESGNLFAIGRDITDLKHKEELLLQSESRFRSFFEISPMGIAINRFSDGKFIDGNKALYDLIGYTEEEYRQLSHWDVTPAKYDDQEAFHKESLFNTCCYGPYEKEYIHKDGSLIPILLNGIKFIDDDGMESVYSVIQDISERKNAEKAIALERSRLQAFVENAPAAVAMLNTELKYVATSNRWKEEYRLEEKDIIGLSHYEVFPNVSQDWKDIHARCLAGAIEKRDEDVWRPEGWDVDQYVKWEVRPWYLFDGSIGGIMMFTQDITKACLQREELKSAKIMAEQASVAKSEFLANMSHEIRTPLNGIIGFTDLVMKTDMDETQKQYISIINQSGNALLNIINDILDFSKIEAGKLELDIVKCDLYETGSQATDIITYQAQSKGLEILLNITPSIPRFIFADDLRLKQILVNLLGNAVKFTDFGEIELKIETFGTTESGKTRYRFEVRDTGIGIKPDKLEKIFEAFSQEDGSTTKKYGGTGLGLTISNKLLDLMGSKLNLKSTFGSGSIFYFDLELDSEEGEPIRWENIDKIKKVLIVDDNQNNRLILKEMFLLKNIKSDEAKDGIEALNYLSYGNEYDVIIMDYHMPLMDGIETIRKIRDNFDALPIVLLHSSSDDEKLIKACDELNVNHRLVKPIKIQDLYNSLSRLHKIENGKESVKPIFTANTEFAPIRVLIAEDNAVNMLLAKTLISRIAPNSIIQEAINGEEAVILCEGKMPDMILMDVQMPEMNGYEATECIRKMTHGDVPIIALTAGNVKGEKEKCLASGMDDFISKPVIEETLAQMFNKWIYQVTDETEILAEVEMKMVHFNPEKIRQFIGNDSVVFKQMLSLTSQELITSSEKLSNHLIDKNLKPLQETAHKLYGTAVTSGLEELGRICKIIEHLPEYDEDVVNKLVPEAISEIELLLKIIEQQ
ncbi:MAG: response regulator [Daejeonella sp.]